MAMADGGGDLHGQTLATSPPRQCGLVALREGMEPAVEPPRLPVSAASSSPSGREGSRPPNRLADATKRPPRRPKARKGAGREAGHGAASPPRSCSHIVGPWDGTESAMETPRHPIDAASSSPHGKEGIQPRSPQPSVLGSVPTYRASQEKVLSMEAEERGLEAVHVSSHAAQGDSHGQVGISSSNLSVMKRKVSTLKHNKPMSKRRRSPLVTITRSPGVRIIMSPMLQHQSLTQARSPMATSPLLGTAVRARSPSVISSSPSIGHRYLGTTRRRKLRSKIWNDFVPTYDGKKLVGAHCKHCNKYFNASRDNGTSACNRHLECCEERAKLYQMVDCMNTSNNSAQATILKNWKFDEVVSQQELIKLIVLHELPFSIVDYPRFKSFVFSLNPLFGVVSRTTIKADCINLYEHQKLALRDVLKSSTSRVSLTADMWTSNQMLGYLCVTCHFIDNQWRIQKRILRFTLVETPHDGRAMFSAMIKSIIDWRVEDRLFAITLDNASANDSMVGSLQNHLLEKHVLPCEGLMFHGRCAAHVFNLIVQEGFKTIGNATSNIRDSVKYVKSSQSRKQRFEAMIEQVGISCEKRPSLDVPTRWNSTYLMLKSALMFRRAFEALARDDTNYVHAPSSKEWEMAENICKMLRVFYNATLAVSASKHPTISSYFHEMWEVKKLLDREASNPDTSIERMIARMNAKFQKYWDISFLTICVPIVLDPRFKMGFLEYRMRKGFGDKAARYLSEVKMVIRILFDEYSLEVGASGVQNLEGDSHGETHVDENNPWADWGQHLNEQQRNRSNELEKYLEEEPVPIVKDFDILQYWMMYSSKYPILSRISRDLLAVPASTVASESAFSTGERVISDYRSRLSTKTVEALICLQDWIRADEPSSSTSTSEEGNEDDVL